MDAIRSVEEIQDQAQELVASAVRRCRPSWMLGTIIAADLLGLGVAFFVAHLARATTGGVFNAHQLLGLWPVPVLEIGLMLLVRGYSCVPQHPADELRRVTWATTVAFLIVFSGTFFLRTAEDYSRAAMFGAWGLAVILIPCFRAWMREFGVRQQWWGVPLICVGAGATGLSVARGLLAAPQQGFKPILFLDDHPNKIGTYCAGLPVFGPIDDVADHCARAGATHVLVAMPGAAEQRMRRLWLDHSPVFPNVLVAPGMAGFASIWVEARDLGGQLALEVRQSLLRPTRRLLKRLMDLAIVLVSVPVVLPLFLFISALVAIASRGPVFYGQRRLGRDGREFTAWKFRTMRPQAERILAEVLAQDPVLRLEWERNHKLRCDPRVTWIGSVLRKSSLDELPQLWNVLIGEMSMVGPRPITPAEIAKYGHAWDLFCRVRPGITGLWQISGRNRTSYEKRVELDTFYVHNWSPWLDIYILARTVRTVLFGEGAY